MNVIAYYSTTILLRAGFQPTPALLCSLGFGIINWIFAIPAFWTIDTFGRRRLLLTTFPFMALCHGLLAIAFGVGDNDNASAVRNGLVIAALYAFGVAYSPGEGPVPFVYAAESMPLYNRDIGMCSRFVQSSERARFANTFCTGMGVVTAINWFFNFFVAITWPPFSKAFKEYGAFTWYAAWCVVGEFAILL